VAKVKAKRRGNGSIAGFVSYTAFGVLALRAAGQKGLGPQASYLVKAQNSDGGFGISTAAASDPDMTGAALQALAAVGRAHGSVRSRAVGWLRSHQHADGGFAAVSGGSTNAQSTAYAVQGLVAAHGGSDVVSRALAYLKRLQRPNGSIRYSSSSAQTPVWVTAQALMALRRKPLPIGTVPRRKKRAHHAAAAAASGGSAAPAAKHAARARASQSKAAHRTSPGATATYGPHASAPPPEVGQGPGTASKTRLASHSGGKSVPAWLVALAVGLALLVAFLGRRRIARLAGARPAFLRRSAG
jgi:prenyltransferase beta subunit